MVAADGRPTLARAKERSGASMRNRRGSWVIPIFGVIIVVAGSGGCSESKGTGQPLSPPDAATDGSSGAAGTSEDGGMPLEPRTQAALEAGRKTFRFETFGDQAFWGDQLKLHQAIEGQAHGGVGPGLSPTMALTVGLKVDAEAIPAGVAANIKA